MPSLQILTLPLLLTLSLPLALLACLTTTFAASILLLRVLLVYAELAARLMPRTYSLLLPISSLNPKSAISLSSSRRNSATPPTPSSPPRTRRSRRLSSVSIASASGFSPAAGLRGSASAVSLPIPRSNALRDFEGVGGWNDGDSEGEGEGMGQWTRINSRLVLPAESPVWLQHGRRRGSVTGLTGGAKPLLDRELAYGVAGGGHSGWETGSATGMWSPKTKRRGTLTHGFTANNTVGEGHFIYPGVGRQGVQSTSTAGIAQGGGGMGGMASQSGSPSTVSEKSSRGSGAGGLVMKGG